MTGFLAIFVLIFGAWCCGTSACLAATIGDARLAWPLGLLAVLQMLLAVAIMRRC